MLLEMLGQENIATVKKKENITTVKKKKEKKTLQQLSYRRWKRKKEEAVLR